MTTPSPEEGILQKTSDGSQALQKGSQEVVINDNSPDWLAECPKDYVARWIAPLVATVCPDMSDESVSMLMRLVEKRRYKKAELSIAVREAFYDPKLADNVRYAKRITPADIERLVKEVRYTRKLLVDKPALCIPHEMVLQILEKHPHLQAKHFIRNGNHEPAEYIYSPKYEEKRRRQQAYLRSLSEKPPDEKKT